MKKLSRPIFVDNAEIDLLNLSEDDEPRWFMPPTIHVTKSHLLDALAEVEKFTEWFDYEIEKILYAR